MSDMKQAIVSGLRFITEDDREVTPGEWRGAWTLLVFLRWLG